ncbi:glycosyltransferase family 2 protein [Flavimarina sp. Hel_I_48]|uniref:glycosyltransferase family 2 protein n=1 Tax=Flavimarina sp. Hel_I_48 TaxID=1392488 RepID=UPI0004DED509|nr:glycosyltransferase family 2 protein [Flavimarina sp. Hel_I_48]
MISIIIPTYNRAHFIIETLQSIQNQTYKHFECFIVDDGSTDGTEDELQTFLNDDRFIYKKRPTEYKKGPSGCRNYGLSNASGDFIVFFDDDDIVHPRNLECCLKEMRSNSYDFCRYQREVFNNKFDYDFDKEITYTAFEIDKSKLPDLITNKLPFNNCAIMWSKKCFDKNRFKEQLEYAEEWELYSRILAEGKIGISIDKTLYYARKHPNSNTGEFYAGNTKRLNSKIEASKLIISNLNKKKLLSPQMIHFFTWESVRFKSKALYKHLIQQPSLSPVQKSKIWIQHTLGPATQFLMRFKKKLK